MLVRLSHCRFPAVLSVYGPRQSWSVRDADRSMRSPRVAISCPMTLCLRVKVSDGSPATTQSTVSSQCRRGPRRSVEPNTNRTACPNRTAPARHRSTMRVAVDVSPRCRARNSVETRRLDYDALYPAVSGRDWSGVQSSGPGPTGGKRQGGQGGSRWTDPNELNNSLINISQRGYIIGVLWVGIFTLASACKHL